MNSIPTFPPRPRGSTLPAWAVVLLSIVAGFGGALLSLWLFPQFRLAEIPPGTEHVIVQQPGQVIVQDDTNLRQTRDQISSQVVGIYRLAAVTGEERLAASGVMLSADGWFVSTSDAHIAATDTVRVGGGTYKISSLLNDASTSLVFGKITSTNNQRFAVAAPQSIGNRFPGISAFFLAGDGLTAQTTVITAAFPFPVGRADASTDRLSYALGVGPAVDAPLAIFPGTPLFDSAGALVGIASANSVVVLPAEIMSTALSRSLSKAAPLSADLKFNYSYQMGDGTPDSAGAVLTGTLPKALIMAGLKAGDKIIGIGGTNMDQPNSLFLALQSVTATTLQVKYRRGEKTDHTTINLSSAPKK